MNELSQLIKKDIAERELIREGIHRIRVRQTVLILVGLLIIIMFFLNYIELRKQISQNNSIRKDLNSIIHVSKIIIDSQDEVIDSLIHYDSLPKINF